MAQASDTKMNNFVTDHHSVWTANKERVEIGLQKLLCQLENANELLTLIFNNFRLNIE